MGTLQSDEVGRVLLSKMKAKRVDRGDWYYKIYDEKGTFVSSTSISKGAKETLTGTRVAQMKRQVGLDTSQQFIDLIECRLSREDALVIMQRNYPPGSPRRR